VRTLANAFGYAVLAGTLVQCSQQQVGTPRNVPLRSYWREVYHTSFWNYRAAFNIGSAREVWQNNPVLAYDTFFVGSEYRGELEPCGIEPIVVSTAITQALYPLVEDSGWKFDEIPLGGGPSQPTLDTRRVFGDFYLAGDSTVPVFSFPRLIRVQSDGSYEWRRVYALTYSSGDVFPSIWLNSREIEFGINFAPANLKPYSVLAHEMAHVLLDPLNFPNQPVWGDESTPFLHIQTHIGTPKLSRRSGVSPGPVALVSADDMNRKSLILYGINDACVLARIHLPFVRPVPP
jgi:hypothetical protein